MLYLFSYFGNILQNIDLIIFLIEWIIMNIYTTNENNATVFHHSFSLIPYKRLFMILHFKA